MSAPRSAIETFSARTGASLLLAALALVIGGVFASGLLPNSQKYIPGHEWYMVAVCSVGAAFFTYCAVLRIRRRREKAQ